LVVLLAPPGWCCAFTPCPLGCCRQAQPNADKASTSPATRCLRCGNKAGTATTANDSAPGRIATAATPPSQKPSSADCPCRLTVGQVVEKITVGDHVAPAWFCAACGAPSLENAGTDRPALEPPLLRPGPDLLKRLCRWLC
jgi:hypothetical protein